MKSDPQPARLAREQIYDEEIAPLMTKIIAVSKAHEIPMVVSFQLDDRKGEGLCFCTTLILPDDAAPQLKAAGRIILDGFAAFAVRVS